jgi:hypothetical protein
MIKAISGQLRNSPAWREPHAIREGPDGGRAVIASDLNINLMPLMNADDAKLRHPVRFPAVAAFQRDIHRGQMIDPAFGISTTAMIIKLTILSEDRAHQIAITQINAAPVTRFQLLDGFESGEAFGSGHSGEICTAPVQAQWRARTYRGSGSVTAKRDIKARKKLFQLFFGNMPDAFNHLALIDRRKQIRLRHRVFFQTRSRR